MRAIITTDVAKLAEVIDSRGVKKRWLAAQMGISETTMMVRLAGKVDFRHSEMVRLSDLLRLTEDEKRAVGWVI